MNHKATSTNKNIILHSEYGAYADFILAQARHESADFTSKVYRDNNNPFGMKVPSKREFLGSVGTKASDGGYYAKYESDSVAFKDYLKWLRAVRFPADVETIEDYARELRERKYYTDSLANYTRALKKWLNKK